MKITLNTGIRIQAKKFLFFLLLLQVNFLHAQFGTPQLIDTTLAFPISYISCGDLDHDSKNDILISPYFNGLFWYKNTGSSFQAMPDISSSLYQVVHTVIKDINHDGMNDILVSEKAHSPAKIHLFMNNGNGSSWTDVLIDDSVDVAVVRSVFSDLDRDGDDDIISCHDLEITTYENLGNGTFAPGVDVAGGNEFYNMVVADFDGDTFPDFAVHSAHGLQLYHNNHAGAFQLASTIDPDLNGLLEAADIDADGDMDLIYPLAGSASDLRCDTNDASGNFAQFSTSYYYVGNVQNPPFCLSFLNQDSFPDVVYAPVVNNGLYTKMNNGTGNMLSANLIDSVYLYRYVLGADLDQDGDNDLVWFAFHAQISRILGWTENLRINNSIASLLPQRIEVFPNPATESIRIKDLCADCSYVLFNSPGQEILQGNNEYLNVSKLPAGLYYLYVYRENSIIGRSVLLKAGMGK